MNINDQALQDVIGSVEASEEGELIVSTEEFWTHFGIQNLMAEAQQTLTELFAAQGLDISFEVVVSLPLETLPQHLDFEVPPAPAALDLTAQSIRALSIQQPWVEHILSGEKNIEYRSYRLKEMGPLLLHASGTVKPENFGEGDLNPDELPYRALVGLVDVVAVHPVEGEDKLYAWSLAHPRRFEAPLPFSGAAGIFRVPLTQVQALIAGASPLPPSS